MKLACSQQTFESSSNIKSHKNPPSGSRVVSIRADMTTPIAAFRNSANAPKSLSHLLKVKELLRPECRPYNGRFARNFSTPSALPSVTPAFPEIEQWAVSYQRLSGNVIPVLNHALHQTHMGAMVAWLHAFVTSALYATNHYNNHTALQSEQNASESAAKPFIRTV